MFKLAGQAGIKTFVSILGLIVFIVLWFIRENICLARAESNQNMEMETMETKMKQNVKILIWSLCNSIWTLYYNVIADVLLA